MTAWRRRVLALRDQVTALWLALRHPQVPRASKLVIVLVVAYALSPLDLVPDVIPVLGWLDDLVIVPLGLWLAVRLMPPAVWAECLARAARERPRPPRSRLGATLVVTLWLGAAALLVWLLRDWLAFRS